MDAQLKKGILQLCILHTIAQGETYGYEIVKVITREFHDVAVASVYTILRRLHAGGYLSIAERQVGNAPARKYYALTPQGSELLRDSLAQFAGILSAVREIGIDI